VRGRPDRGGLGLRLAAGLWSYWHPSGQLGEAADWLKDALERAGRPERARAAALGALGLIASFQGDQERAVDLLTARIECAQSCGDRHSEGRALTNLSQARALSGDLQGAADSCQRALAVARQADDAWVEGSALFRFGIAKALTGDIAGAKLLAAASIGVFPRTGDRRLRGYGQMVLADCLTREGSAAEAVDILRDALAFFEALPERWALLRAAGLLAEAFGLTNRQIGARLFIAERTVDTHVGRILAKLGCTTRAQVAALIAGRETRLRGLPGPADDGHR